MGKKSKLKKIRKIADTLPDLVINRMQGSIVDSKELMAQGVTEVEGKPLKNGVTYRNVQSVQAPMNHNRRMKKIYNKYGAIAIGSYMAAVHRQVAKHTNTASNEEKA